MRILITGSSRGIGKALMEELEFRGHKIRGVCRSVGVDVSNYQQVARALDGEPYDVLINNAGIVVPGTILETSPADWLQQFAVNVHGVYNCCREYVKANKATGGKIINIASTAGLMVPRPGRAAYAATKAAVVSLSLSLAEELRDYGIQVYCIAPGACNTQLRQQIAPDDDFDAMLQPAQLARFLADVVEGGELLDGQVIITKGGQHR